MPKKKSKQIGDSYGRLRIIEDLGTRPVGSRGSFVRFYLCECECGGKIEVRCGDLGQGRTQSCGCLRREVRRGVGNPKKKLEIGDKYDRLTIIEDLGTRPIGHQGARTRYFLCECECGNKVEVRAGDIGGKTKSCGCLHRDTNGVLIPPGTLFDRLTVLELGDLADRKPPNYSLLYRCKCSCGNIVTVRGDLLRSGNTTSCGCKNRERGSENLQSGYAKMYVEGTNIASISSDKPNRRNTTGVRGVTERNGKWIAAITFKKRRYSLGTYDALEDAAHVRKQAACNIYGAFLESYRSRSSK